MKPVAVLLLLCFAAPLWSQDGDKPYSITADTVRKDGGNDVTTYQGNAKAEVADLVIEADTISISHDNGLPSRIEASGDPLKFHRQASDDQFNGTAQRIIFVVPELKLTLIDYIIADPSGNNMKGKKASIVLDP